ncbi:hypothetical protein ASH00_06785 [Arthrobacter sp. Soil782]|uniref:DUF4192 domain-containing protein n=1 Tax=Arthrobacter sp. Soil782 TaxID=1736410 RepID=UPI000700FA50|nr:DUF4192 domain-containing protein [Arthrobacter sp. Soil782]KRF09326.1 hypothetical protein ASH00_06785 [Arthrobacter sp. Soil782]
MSKTPISVTSPADILAYIPHTLGFTPADSFVFLTLRGKQLGATLRIDAPQQDTDPARFAQAILGYLSNDVHADGTLLVVYTDRATIDGTKPYSDHANTLDELLGTAGMPVRDSWLVTSTEWMTYFCEDADCCTPHSLEEITDSVLSAHMVFEGSTTTRETVANPDFTGDNTDVDRIADIITSWVIEDPTDWTTPVMTENQALWQETLGAEPGKDTTLQLIAALHTPALRDRIMADTISDDDDLGTFADVFLGKYAGAPDWNRVDAVQELIIELLRHTPPGARAPLFTFLGWIYWYKGRSSIAAQYLTRAREADPASKLPQLLTQLVNTGQLAECVKHEKTAYHR